MTVVRSTGRYDRQPTVVVPGTHRVWIGADAWLEVDRHASDGGRRAPLVVLVTRCPTRLGPAPPLDPDRQA